jgi:hypothetical protein
VSRLDADLRPTPNRTRPSYRFVTAAIANDGQRDDDLEKYMPQNQGTNPQNQPTHDNPSKGGQNMPPGNKTGTGKQPAQDPGKGGQHSQSGQR